MVNIQSTTWYPDTCDCALRFSSDLDSPPPRTYTISSVNRACDNHKILLPNAPVTFNTVMEENNRKSTIYNTALEALPSDLADTVVDDNGVTTVQLKQHITFQFFYTGTAPNRILNINFINSNLSPQKKNQLQTAIDNKIGAGKVVLT